MSRISAGLMMYRLKEGQIEVLLAHPGGPIFARKDDGHWTIPKGEVDPGEDLLNTAIREFQEETGIGPRGDFTLLGWIQQKGGKIVHAWAFQGDLPQGHAHCCNTFTMEWPPRSGKTQSFPEVDRVCFFDLAGARQKLKATQHPFLDRLSEAVAGRSAP